MIRSGRLDEGERLLDQVEAGYRRDAKMNERWLRYVAGTRAELLLRQGRIDDGRTVMKGLGYPKETESIELVPALPLAAEIELAAKRPDAALRLATDAVTVARRRARVGDASADVGKAWLQVARVREASNDADGGREAIGHALVALANGLGNNHVLTQEARKRAQSLGMAPVN